MTRARGTRPEGTPVHSNAVGVLAAEEVAAEPWLSADAAIWGVVLAGGIGSRFWPLSSPKRPKQLLRLIGDRPLIADTIGRLHPLIPAERVLVVTSADIAGAIHASIPHVPPQNLLIEPRPLGTAASLAWAASEIARRAGPDTLGCVMHADLAVGFPDAFRHTVRHAALVAAREDRIAAIGVRPARPEPAFGYLELAEAVPPDAGAEWAGRTKRFVEKPVAAEAAYLIGRGALWHSGIAAFRASHLLALLQTHTPEVAGVLAALAAGTPGAIDRASTSVSIERGLYERCDSLHVVLGEFGWDDVGTWASLKRARELDDRGNGVVGDAHFLESAGNIVHAEGATVALYGVDGLLVVTLDGLTFVTRVERAADLKSLLDELPPDVKRQGA